MALLLLAGALAGAVLAATGHADTALAGALALPAITGLLALAYRACEPLETAARGLRIGGNANAARLLALLFGLLPMLALAVLQLAAARLVAGPAPALLAAGWFYAIATGPATLLAALTGRERRTLWAIRAYAAHLAGWIWLALGAPDVTAGGVLLALVPAALPVTVGALIALADPRALRSARI